MAITPNVLLNTQGSHLLYAVETTAGTRPTAASAFTELEQIVSIPDMQTTPNVITSTPLSETVQEHTAAGLKSAFDALEFQFNSADSSDAAWSTMVTAYTALTGGLKMWFCITHDNKTMASYFTGTPLELSQPGIDGDSPLLMTGYIVPTSSIVRAAKPA